jgi:demethylmenaquinone methyltransferase/2-methoxy-6-polyprenyl-1,4-benzoquinol methylase
MIEWNPVYATFVDPILSGTRRAMLRAVPAGARVLDVACGTGDLARILASKASEVVGVELNPERVAWASKRASPKTRFQVGDARALPFADRSFDLATISMALHEMPAAHRPVVFEELLRVAPEALVVDYTVPQPRNPMALGVRGIEGVAGAEHYRGFRSFLEQGGLVGLAERAGARAALEATTTWGCIGLWRVRH